MKKEKFNFFPLLLETGKLLPKSEFYCEDFEQNLRFQPKSTLRNISTPKFLFLHKSELKR